MSWAMSYLLLPDIVEFKIEKGKQEKEIGEIEEMLQETGK